MFTTVNIFMLRTNIATNCRSHSCTLLHVLPHTAALLDSRTIHVNSYDSKQIYLNVILNVCK